MKSLELQMRQMSALLEESNARAAANAMSDSVSARQQRWSGNLPTRVRAAAVNGSDDVGAAAVNGCDDVEAQELYESSAVAVSEPSSAARQSTDSSDEAAAPKAAHSQ